MFAKPTQWNIVIGTEHFRIDQKKNWLTNLCSAANNQKLFFYKLYLSNSTWFEVSYETGMLFTSYNYRRPGRRDRQNERENKSRIFSQISCFGYDNNLCVEIHLRFECDLPKSNRLWSISAFEYVLYKINRPFTGSWLCPFFFCLNKKIPKTMKHGKNGIKKWHVKKWEQHL